MRTRRSASFLLIVTASMASARPAHAQAVAPTPPPPPPAGDQEPWLELRVSGLVQADAVMWNAASADELDPATREPLNEDRFVLRRARIRLDAARSVVRGHIAIDANAVYAAAVRVQSAEVAAGWPPAPRLPWVLAGLGLFYVPFGFEPLEPEAGAMFLEPSIWVRALLPGKRDLGVRVAGHWYFLHYHAALMNGNPSSSAVFPLRDPNRAKDLVGRLGVDGELADGLRMRAGASLLLGTGFHAGRAESKDTLVWRDANEDGVVQNTEIQAIAGAPAEASRNFDRFALGGDIVADAEIPVLGRLRVQAEIVWANNADRGLLPADPIALGRDQRELAFAVSLRQMLTRHVEFGVRYDRYDPDLDASDQQGPQLVPVDSSFSTWAFAAAWCTYPGLRVSLEYDRNHNALGRDASGQPTTLAADVLTARAQMEL